MKISQWLKDAVQSIWNDVGRLFQPTNDDYPKSGVQPFQGEPPQDQEKYS